MKNFALIVAGGNGRRMGNVTPKQFLELNGKPVLMHTIQAFHNFDSTMEIIIVLPEDKKKNWEILCLKHQFNIKHNIVSGGENRFSSVQNGLNTIKGEGIVFVHDGVRPLVSKKTLKACLDGTIKNGNAIPVVPVTESLRKTKGTNSKAVNRRRYYHVQTPQTFVVSKIKKAYRQQYNEQFTDDASVLEKLGATVFMVEGNYENIKITRPLDLIIAESLLKQ